MRIGRPWSDDPAGEPLPIEKVSGLVKRIEADGGLQAMIGGVFKPRPDTQPQPLRIDADGFRHFQGVQAQAKADAPPSALAGVLRDLGHAARIDAGGGQ